VRLTGSFSYDHIYSHKNGRILQYQAYSEYKLTLHAAGASMLSLARGVFAGMRSACGVRWAWRTTAGLCHAFLVLP